MVTVEGLCKSFDARPKAGERAGFKSLAAMVGAVSRERVQVLKSVSFTAEPGKIYGLLGPNGAGKTTTLRCIATLLKPDSGTITVGGQSYSGDARALRAKIGFLTSDMKMSGNLTPRELLAFFGKLNQLDEGLIARRTGELATYLDMRDCLDTPVDKCSTGQKQKASIAVSLVHDPELIIFDEPTNGLDILAAKTVVDFLKDYRDRGRTVILSTHIMAEAESLCDRIGIMLGGQIVAEGSREALLKQYEAADLSSVFFGLAKTKGLLHVL